MKLNNIKFAIKKHSPEIFGAIGIVGVLSSGVMACKATLKLKDVLMKHKQEREEIINNSEIEEMDPKNDLRMNELMCVKDLIKLYLPSAVLAATSVCCIWNGGKILKQRNAALSSALVISESAFSNYRERVREKYGEKEDLAFRYDIKEETVEEIIDDNGKKKKVKKKAYSYGDSDYSDYCVIWDAASYEFNKDIGMNLIFLKAQERYLNERLKVEGMLFLNEVYDALGTPRTKAGQVVGWRYDPNNESIDNEIKFIAMVGNEAKLISDLTEDELVKNGMGPELLLDFNVDGNVWSDMPEWGSFK